MSKAAKACWSLAILSWGSRCQSSTVSAWSSSIQSTIITASRRSRSNLCASPLLLSTRQFQAFQQSNTIVSMASTDESSTTTSAIAANIAQVRENIRIASDKAGNDADVRLVAVSKTKPLELLVDAYENANQRVFGENYVQELVEKVPQMPDDIQWHFIGSLQSNKANSLVKSVYPRKLVVETLSSLKLANKLNNAMSAAISESDDSSDETQLLDVYIQINTSGEESKSGIPPDTQELVEICQHVKNECEFLNLKGLMTIGAPGDMTCFETLVKCRETVCKELGLDDGLELSMGMSGDYEQAISYGATNVRVGSTIFGARDYSK